MVLNICVVDGLVFWCDIGGGKGWFWCGYGWDLVGYWWGFLRWFFYNWCYLWFYSENRLDGVIYC